MRKNLKKWYPSVIASEPRRGERSNLKKRDCFGPSGLAMTLTLFTILCMFLTSCGPGWKKKFVRKRAESKPEPVFVYEPQAYQREPNDVLYKRHFIFWKSWQEELVNNLGENKASDLRAFEETLKSLGEMKECLTDQKAAELEAYVKKLEAFYNIYKSKDFDVVRSRQMRQNLDRLMLKIDKIFRYNRAKTYIK